LAELGIREPMMVKDIMSSPVITIKENGSAGNVAALMEKNKVGCVVVTAGEDRPIGIITERDRDLVVRVVASDLKPSKVAVKEIMSTPLITIGPDETLNEAGRMMSRLNIRRLGVMYKGELVGIVSSKDILSIMPELIEIIQEKTRIANQGISTELLEQPPLAGYCDNCGQWADDLTEVEGNFLCEDCQLEVEREE
jgi:CBS domain-containing protein